MLTQTTSLAQQIAFIITNYLIPIVFSLALLYFFYGIAKYIRSESPGGKAEGQRIMVWGVIALFVMVSVWGLVRFIQTELNETNNSSIQIPTIGGGGQDINL